MRRLMNRPLFALFLSAFFTALPMTVPSCHWIGWVSLVPFFYVLVKQSEQKGWFRALGRGIFFGFFLHFFVYYWFLWLYPLSFAGFEKITSLAIVLLAWLGISLAHGALFGIPSLFIYLVSKKIKSRSFLIASTALVTLLSVKMTQLSALAFPWVRFSLGQYRATALIQSASVFGMDGVDLLILAVSGLLALAFFVKQKKRIFAISFAFLLFFANLVFGLIRINLSDDRETLAVAAVQGNILSGEKWDGSDTAEEVYTELTLELAESEAELVVWPETATATNLGVNSYRLGKYQALSAEIGKPILVGCFWKFEGKNSNSAVLITQDSVSEVYSKRHLVPFGEKMPYREFLGTIVPSLTKINLLSSDLYEAQEATVIESPWGNLAPVICFESLFPQLTKDSVNAGGELIVLVTNDSWYEDSPGVWQHLAHAVFRSVESDRDTVRAANSGVSALIDHTGRITAELGPLEKGNVVGTVHLSDSVSLYNRIGNILLPSLCFLVFLWGIVCIFSERRRRIDRQKGIALD